MPMSPLDAKRFLLTFTEELATTLRPFFGINIVDVSAENVDKFFELFTPFGEPGYPIADCLRFAISWRAISGSRRAKCPRPKRVARMTDVSVDVGK